MAKYSRLKVLTTILETGFVPILYHPDVATMVNIIQACAEGGARVFEFTNRGDQAHEVFKELFVHFKNDERVILGAGSILDAGTASLFIQLGANFIVGPVLNPDVAKVCNRRKVAYIPGCGSASEISLAEELGAEICKIFPGNGAGGPGFIKDVLAPMPWSRLMPTGGVEPTEESIQQWLKAGAACVGVGSRLFPTEVIAAGNYKAITDLVRQVSGWVKAARGGKPVIR